MSHGTGLFTQTTESFLLVNVGKYSNDRHRSEQQTTADLLWGRDQILSARGKYSIFHTWEHLDSVSYLPFVSIVFFLSASGFEKYN